MGLLLAFGNCKCPRSGEILRQMWCGKRLVYPMHALHGSGQLSNPRGLVPRKVMVTHRSSPSSVRLIVVVLGEESIYFSSLPDLIKKIFGRSSHHQQEVRSVPLFTFLSSPYLCLWASYLRHIHATDLHKIKG
jgi:hypothetical protein